MTKREVVRRVQVAVPQMLTIAEVAKRFGVSTRTVSRWIDRGELRSYELGRPIRVSEEDANSFLASRRR